MEYKIKNGRNYLLFTFDGKYDFEDSINLMQAIKSDCINNKIFKILIDARQVDKQSLSNLNRFNMGVEAGKTLNSKIQVAVLDNEDDINHFAELTANNRSAYVKISSDRTELVNWLT